MVNGPVEWVFTFVGGHFGGFAELGDGRDVDARGRYCLSVGTVQSPVRVFSFLNVNAGIQS